jgi:hypothetical protein
MSLRRKEGSKVIDKNIYLNRKNRAKRLENFNKVCNVGTPWKITDV